MSHLKLPPTGQTLPSLPMDTHAQQSAAPTQQAGPANGPETHALDQFEPTPGASFTNHLLGLDANADGTLTRAEIAAGATSLQQLASDGREVDGAESSVLRFLMQRGSDAGIPSIHYSFANGQLQLHAGEGPDAPQLTIETNPEVPEPADGFLLQGPSATVVHGTDPGDFYCEHMFFTSQLAASQPGSSVATNAQGEKLVGFLHVPTDRYTSQATPSGYTQAERHDGTRQVIGAALRGYFDQISPQMDDPQEPIRMLVTGYGAFGWARNNPTGEFASHQENLDASMQRAFGEQLVTAQGEHIPPPPGQEGPTNAHTYRYIIRDEHSGNEREILLTRAQFTVDDSAISPGSDTSIQQIMAHTSPHGVIAMGVAGRGHYKAEHHADNGGLQREGETNTHVNGSDATVQLRDNYALARAIQNGQR